MRTTIVHGVIRVVALAFATIASNNLQSQTPVARSPTAPVPVKVAGSIGFADGTTKQFADLSGLERESTGPMLGQERFVTSESMTARCARFH